MKLARSSEKPAVVRSEARCSPWQGPGAACRRSAGSKPADLKPAIEAEWPRTWPENQRVAVRLRPLRPVRQHIPAMERSGHTLGRVSAVYGIYTSTMNDSGGGKGIEREMSGPSG